MFPRTVVTLLARTITLSMGGRRTVIKRETCFCYEEVQGPTVSNEVIGSVGQFLEKNQNKKNDPITAVIGGPFIYKSRSGSTC